VKRTVTAGEIAEATGDHRTTVIRTLDNAKAVFVWRKGASGNEKHYPLSVLTEEYRVALKIKKAAPECDEPDSLAGIIGVQAAQEILVARAEEKERELIAKEQGLEAFERLPEQRKKEALARHALLQLCDGFVQAAGFDIPRHAQRSKKADRAFIEAYNAGHITLPEDIIAVVGEQTSYSTLRRIAEGYHKHGLPGLALGYHSPKRGQTTLSEDQQTMVISTMCMNPNTSTTNIRKILQGKFGREVPSADIISRFRINWIKENEELWMFYTNPDEWKNKCLFAFGSASEHVERLNQLWEADSTPADLMLADGRHSIIGMIDVYSRRLRYFVSKTSKAVSVVALLRHCIIEWGVPEVLKIDNGKDYRSAHVTRVLDSLEIQREYCTPFQGQEKPHIERSFHTFLHGLVELMPKYIGHNVTERKAIEARRSFADRVMKKDSDPVDVNLTAEELQKFCNEWTEFVYQHDPHSGLNGKKPIDMVRNWKQPRRCIHDMRALDMLLMPAPRDGGKRTIEKKGIQVDNRFFQAKEFAGNKGKEVFVLLDPVDMGTIYVYLYGDRGERDFLCVAIDPKWHGIDRAKFSTASRNHQTRFMREGAKQLKEMSKKEGQREAYADYVNFRKSEVANMIQFPLPSEEHTTPALTEAAKAVTALDLAMDRQDGMEKTLREVEIILAEEKAAPVPVREQKVLQLITCKSDRYLDILASTRMEKRKLTQWEYDFLTDFYTNSDTGKAYLLLEGDLRMKVGLADASLAKG